MLLQKFDDENIEFTIVGKTFPYVLKIGTEYYFEADDMNDTELLE